MCFCFSLNILPQNVDVNVHPTKHEVHFLHEDAVIEAIQRAVDTRLLGANSSRTYYMQVNQCLSGPQCRLIWSTLSFYFVFNFLVIFYFGYFLFCTTLDKASYLGPFVHLFAADVYPHCHRLVVLRKTESESVVIDTFIQSESESVLVDTVRRWSRWWTRLKS